MEEKYETLMDLGSWEFGVTSVVRQRKSKELFAVKCINRGEKIDGNLLREIINHRSLRHPNIIKFEEVLLTPTHLAIVMEYAAGEELLYHKVRGAGRLTEDGARLFFQQLISAELYHRNLKLEKTLLVESPAPRVKICAFGYPKSGWSHLHRKSNRPTPACLQPEVLSRMEYDMKIADVYVWSCGITLYAMLVGAYAFEYPDDWNNYGKIVERIMSAQYSIPDYVSISADCKHLLSRIFVANPSKRITIPEIKKHPWFLKNYPKDLTEGEKNGFGNEHKLPQQNVDEITKIIEEAKVPAVVVSTADDDLQRDLESEIDNDDNFAKGILFYTGRNYIDKTLME